MISPQNGKAWLDLARLYQSRDLPWQALYAARQAVRCDRSLSPQIQALDVSESLEGDDSLLGRPQLNQAAALVRRFSAALENQPCDWLTSLYAARLYELPGVADAERHVQMLASARQLEPIQGETLHWLGVWRLNAGDAQGAMAALAPLIDVRPLRYGSMMYLGEALLRVGNVAAAEKAFTRASLSFNPDFLLTLAARVFANNYWREAVAVLQKALSLRPHSVPAWVQLAKVHWDVYELSKAQDACGRILALDPGNEEAVLMLAALPGRMGDARAHLASVQSEYADSGQANSRLASSTAMASLYNDEMSADEIAALHRSLCARIESGLARATDFTNEKTPRRRLRVGYVTGDLYRQHPVNLFMLPVLKRHDRKAFEVCIYYTGSMHDDCTRQAKACADRWHEAGRLDDAALRQLITADGVDLLIDLAGHTSTHRLGVFAMRAAPVQATFLGYPHSTGLSNIDWLIGDPIVSPAEHSHLFSEGIAQLPGSVFCWAPVDDYPLPAARAAHETPVFGSFNNVMKLTPATIVLWAEVLKAVPNANLLLKAPSLRDDAVKARFAGLFQEQGIDAARLIMRGPTGLADMMQEYGDMDIALDPLPYNGGTTSLQAMWMGVPVVTLAGSNFASRMGASFMTALGEPDWIGRDGADYVAKAARMARRVASIRMQRAALRERMRACPLSDIETYTRNLEALYRRMWAAHCAGESHRLLLAMRTVQSVQEPSNA